MRHFVLPRPDYDILPDSWNVVGLAGTGSKDIVVENAFVPDHRTLDAHEVGEGILAERNRPGNPLYAMPFGVMFSSAISAATLGIAEGALAAFLAYTRRCITIVGSRAAEPPHQLTGLGEAAADLDASRTHLLATMDRMYEDALAGRTINLDELSRRALSTPAAAYRTGGGRSPDTTPVPPLAGDVVVALSARTPQAAPADDSGRTSEGTGRWRPASGPYP
ncbi:hypothetical protein [Streptomyces sp. NPDC055793]